MELDKFAEAAGIGARLDLSLVPCVEGASPERARIAWAASAPLMPVAAAICRASA